jgi:hypothetical protein
MKPKTPPHPKIVFEDITGCSSPNKLPRMIRRIIETLDAYPDGKLMSTRLLAEKLSVVAHAVHSHGAHPAIEPYRIRLSNAVYWGNKPTVIQANEKE